MIGDYKEQIKNKIEEIAKAQGIELVDFKLSFYGSKYTLRCIADYPTGGITVDDCATLNEKIFSFLDENNLLGGDYVVEVNSPGLDTPLKTYKDFLRVKTGRISLWFNEPFEGKEYLEGELLHVTKEDLSLKCKDKVYKIDFNKIKTGRERLEFKAR